MERIFQPYVGKYALCTTAKCLPIPNDSKHLNCYCDIKYGLAVGLNIGNNSYQPFNSSTKEYMYSLYSGYNNADLDIVRCDKGTWGSCIDKLCVASKMNPQKAWCQCEAATRTPWISFKYKSDKKPVPCDNLSGSIFVNYEVIETYYKSLIDQ